MNRIAMSQIVSVVVPWQEPNLHKIFMAGFAAPPTFLKHNHFFHNMASISRIILHRLGHLPLSASRRAPIGQWHSELYEHLLHPLLHHWVHAQAHLFWMQGKTSRPQGSGNLVQIPLGLSLLCFLVILVMDWLLFSISMLTSPSYSLLWIYCRDRLSLF